MGNSIHLDLEWSLPSPGTQVHAVLPGPMHYSGLGAQGMCHGIRDLEWGRKRSQVRRKRLVREGMWSVSFGSQGIVWASQVLDLLWGSADLSSVPQALPQAGLGWAGLVRLLHRECEYQIL